MIRLIGTYAQRPSSVSQFGHESRVRAGRTPHRRGVASEIAVAAMAVAHRLQKVHVLDFRDYNADIRGGHSVHDSASSHHSTSPKRTHRTDFLDSRRRHFWGGGVEHLERKILGERLGNRRKRNVYSNVLPTIHHPRTTRLGPPRRCVVCWTTRSGLFRVAR
jgi:hypothetical protein